MEIILLRHGKPKIPSLEKVNATDFLKFVESYNRAGLCPSSLPPTDAISMANSCNAFVCSELQRSIDSSKALGITNITLKSVQFNEAGLPAANWKTPKLSPRLWAAFFRVMWLFGFSENSESFKVSKYRASLAAKLLIDLANKHDRVLFIGHGVYNRLLANELRNSGWIGPKIPGVKYWSYGVYRGTKV